MENLMKLRIVSCYWLILAVILTLCPGAKTLYGQAGAGAIDGIVLDESGAVIPNAHVTLIRERTGDIRRVLSNSEGFLSFVALPAGDYSIEVEVEGFSRFTQKNITLHPGDKITLRNLVLKPGDITITVDVTASLENVIPQDSSEKASVVTSRQIQDLAIVGRSAVELLKILPGVVNQWGDTGEIAGFLGGIGSYNVAGTRNDALDIVSDGANVIAPECNCGSAVTPNVDLVQEFTVQTASFSAENARGPVVINTVSKSGTSRFHGETSHRTKLENETSIGMLERAVLIDPTFAAGYAELATVYLRRRAFFTPDEKHWEEKAATAASKALSLDPDSFEAYLARGTLLLTPSNRFQYERAVQDFHQALSLNPNSDEGHDRLAMVYNHIGLLDKGLAEAQKSLVVNPNFLQAQIANSLLWQGKYEDGLATWQSLAKEANPAVVGSHTAWAMLQLGRKEQAAATIDKFLREHPEDTGGLLSGMQALLLAASGEEHKSEAKIKIALEKKSFGDFHHTAHYVASAYALMKKPEPAVHWLQQAAETGFPCYPLFEHDPNLNSLRKNPLFISFMEELKKRWEHYRDTL
jgi:tetratricopeptide (TPR) repeat protein